MNEHELKNALQDAMVASSPPPSMSPEAAVEAGRAANRRRRATLGGAVAGLAVVAIAVGAVLVPQFTGGAGGGAVIDAGGQSSGSPTPSSISPTPPAVTPTGNPSATGSVVPMNETGPEWPNGQTDRTQTSGPRADKSVRMLNDLVSALPQGYQAVDKQPVDQRFTGNLRHTQSQFSDYYDGRKEVWEYLAATPVARKGDSSAIGKLWIQVTTKGGELGSISSPCDATERAWAIQGTCEVLDVGGRKVGFITADAGGDRPDLDQLVIYKHDDGTVVMVGQAQGFVRSGHPALDALPFTRDQLVAQATDAKYHLD
ncbi:hypothetical protein FHS29_002449 [Saccharothrix tamanrassetensis]|uniref:Uncharacterized protein n=1 Tax=Saccharothrix tamanrassetensis TaxID=1051531 RepID=A0A841CI48_9PSEU|nr:hypothetical protein [Saccharothrix tamanrassetensis]MBB5955868.1 hypothetical protein [Saccharothrix tamanrassetensis]